MSDHVQSREPILASIYSSIQLSSDIYCRRYCLFGGGTYLRRLRLSNRSNQPSTVLAKLAALFLGGRDFPVNSASPVGDWFERFIIGRQRNFWRYKICDIFELFEVFATTVWLQSREIIGASLHVVGPSTNPLSYLTISPKFLHPQVPLQTLKSSQAHHCSGGNMYCSH